MIRIKSFITDDTYFAARNGHRGFESLFKSVFSPDDYNKIYILKGGPGTGKSTLMRGLVSLANECGIACDAVLCSSDPSSLDGVIMSRNGRRAAVLDGTAPHTTDPKYPGAVEEIINLGDGFDLSVLEAQRREIIELNRAKSEEYSRAYGALTLAHHLFNDIWHKILNSEIYSVAEDVVSEIKEELSSGQRVAKEGEILYSAFGKDGYKRLPLRGGRRVINMTGEPFVCAAVMHVLSGELSASGRLLTRSPSALDQRLIDRLYTSDLVVTCCEDGASDIDLSDYSPDGVIPDYTELVRSYRALLDVSSAHFRRASEVHFDIERIYSSCIDFNNNDRVYATLSERLLKLLA